MDITFACKDSIKNWTVTSKYKYAECNGSENTKKLCIFISNVVPYKNLQVKETQENNLDIQNIQKRNLIRNCMSITIVVIGIILVITEIKRKTVITITNNKD